jgi:DNA polymerase III subunit epsilon
MNTPQQLARQLLSDCHILDTETTGLDNTAEVVEISIIDHAGNVVFDTLVKPKKPIPAAAAAIHGITNEMVAAAPTWPEIHDQVCQLLTSKPVAIYNADYDLRILRQTAALHDLAMVDIDSRCVMLAYAEFWGDWNEYRGSYRWQKLTEAAKQQAVVIQGQAHRALADVRMTLGVMQGMAVAPDD